MIEFQTPDLPGSFVETVCPKTYAATYSSPEWTDIQLTDEYRVTFHLVGAHILSSYPKGNVTHQGTKALFEAYDAFLKASGLASRPFVEISDYSGVRNLPSKRTRIEVADQLMKKVHRDQLIGHFVYNAPRHIRWIYNIAIRLKEPEIPMIALDTYEEALTRAMTIRSGAKHSRGIFRNIPEKLFPLKKGSSRHIQDILDYIGSINWDEKGMQENQIPESHPLKSVFNAIAILKADHDRTHHDRDIIQRK